MISADFFDHTVAIWGYREGQGSTFREAERGWFVVAGQDDVAMAIQTRRETLANEGMGERVVGEYRGYGPASLDVCEGDVIEVHTGPMAPPDGADPVLLKVDGVYRPSGRHTELTLIQWDGELA